MTTNDSSWEWIEIDSKINPKSPPKYDALVLSGGGVKLLATLGVLYYYFVKGELRLENLKHITGASAGCLVSILLQIGMTPLDIFSEIYEGPPIFNVLSLNGLSAMRSSYGLLNIKLLQDRFAHIITKKIGFIPTLRELHSLSKIELDVPVTNESENKPEYFTADTHPTASVVEVGCISCCIPMIFGRAEFGGRIYVDAALTDNFPIKRVCCGPPKTILGVIVEDDPDAPDSTFIEYFAKIISIPIRALTQLRSREYRPEDKVNIVTVVCKGGVTDYNLTKEDKMRMFKNGFESAYQQDPERNPDLLL